jgi:hypothetical protein
MKQQRIIKFGKNAMTIECKDTVSNMEISAFISHGEVLEVTEGNWRTSHIIFAKDGDEHSETLQEAMASLIYDWPQFYGKVKSYSREDKLWSIARAEEFARKQKIDELTTKIDKMTEELKVLNRRRTRLQLPDPGKKGERHGKRE